jgi:DNA modification methylase
MAELYFENKKVKIYHGEVETCNFEANTFYSVLTDPPYGLAPIGNGVAKTGFKGHGWDNIIPKVETWKQILGWVRPGSYMLSFGSTRTHHRLSVAIEDAGWLLRDCLMWLYGGGFTKANYASNAVARSGHDILSKQWAGYANALKPAWEPVLLCQKPLDGTYGKNIAKWGCGALNINGCRVRYKDEDITEGRWPANIIVDDKAAEAIDESSGITKSTPNLSKYKQEYKKGVLNYSTGGPTHYEDKGGASRYFKRICYESRATSKERSSKGCVENNHPTLKPIALICYLATLILSPEPSKNVIFIPFSGSGSEILGCLEAGWNHIVAVEKEEGYCEIAKERIKYYFANKFVPLDL